MKPEYSIGELADASGVGRRTIRFYVQQGLLDPPSGRGRGGYYEAGHLERLRRIRALQEAGHSLAAVREILAGVEPARPRERRSGQRPGPVSPRLWVRLRLTEGVEVHLDATRYEPSAATVRSLRAAVVAALDPESQSNAQKRARRKARRRE